MVPPEERWTRHGTEDQSMRNTTSESLVPGATATKPCSIESG
jgi:hypothetical protein